MIEINNYIGGEHLAPLSGGYLDNENPATGKVYSKVPDSKKEDALKAIEAAKYAFPAWRDTPRAKRVAVIRKLADLIKKNAGDLAKAESIDNGKPLTLATHVDIPRASTNFEFFADAISQFNNEAYDMDGQAINYVLRQPLGVVVCISPWNLPLYLLTWKIAPALLAGNTVVAKPSEVTPMTAFLLSELCREAGLPSGVLNIIHGTGPNLGETLCTHPDVKAVSFTGSTATGKIIATSVAPHFKKFSLEMGGKNPNIIFADCDFDKAMETTVMSSFSNQGQICLCSSRIYVERPIYEKFRDTLVEKAKSLKVGNPLDKDSNLGAVVSRQHYEKILRCLETAKEEGGKILCGGGPAEVGGEHAGGYFIQPTIIEGLGENCRTNQEEIFGPVVTIAPFDTEEEVIAWANGTDYGLSGTIWTKDLDKGHRVAARVDGGVLWVNCWLLRDLRTPFGGMKSSGVGREGGLDAFKFYTEPKNVCIKLGKA